MIGKTQLEMWGDLVATGTPVEIGYRALPCPWCGSTRDLVVIADGDERRPRRRVWCPMCDIVGPEHLDDAGAVQAWNSRAMTRLRKRI